MSSDLVLPGANARLVQLASDARRYIDRARSERTKAAYTYQWRYFVAWCRAHGEPHLPARPEAIALYLADGADRGLQVATLSQAMSAISEAHRVAGQGLARDHPVLRETMRGIRRVAGRPQRGRSALLPEQLRAILDAITVETASGLRDRALLLLGFLGGFRRSELVALKRSDLRMQDKGMVVRLFGNKDDVALVGRDVPVLRGKAPHCAVQAVQAWIERAGGQEDEHVFRSVDRHGNIGRPLRGGDVAVILKRRAAVIGLKDPNISAHSLRAGFVTAAHLNGAPLEAIMKITGHKSYDMTMRYIRKADLFSQHPADGLL